MKNPLPISIALAVVLSAGWAAPACAQASFAGAPTAAISLVRMLAAQKKASDAVNARTLSTATYRGQSFPMKRCPEDVLAGDAADRIAQVENQLSVCNKALLADSTGRICPPEQQTAIRENFKYIGTARPGWNQQAYRQEFKFYLAEDKRRQQAAK